MRLPKSIRIGSYLTLAFITLASGIYLLRKSGQMKRSLLNEYQIFSNSRVFADNHIRSDISKGWSYVFPGNKVLYTVSGSSAIPCEVEFLPLVIGVDSIQWCDEFNIDVFEGGTMGAKVDYYRGVPWDMIKVGTGAAPDLSPMTSLEFIVTNNRDLIGRQLSFRIITAKSIDTIDIAISDPDEIKSRMQYMKFKAPFNFVMLLGVILFGLSWWLPVLLNKIFKILRLI